MEPSRTSPAEQNLTHAQEETAAPRLRRSPTGRFGLAVKDEVLVAGSIIGSVQHFLKIDRSGFVRGPERNGNHWQPVSQPDRPEIGGPSLLGSADHHRIVAIRPPFLGHGIPSPQQVDFYEVSWAAQQLSTLGEVLFAIVTGSLVGRAQ